VPHAGELHKCSGSISLTDIIESHKGRLSHIDCSRPQALTPEERALIFLYCAGHVVAYCVTCSEKYGFTQLASDLLGGRTNMCPRCRHDLTEQVRAHLFGCTMLPSEVRLRARAVREAAQNLVKESLQLRDTSDVLIQEAEALLFERRRSLREVMSRRAVS